MCRKQQPCVLFIVGTVLVVFAGISIPLLHLVIHQQVQEKVSLHNESQTYAMWIEPSVPIYMEVYVFDLMNPEEVLQGGKPYMEQKGPYVYEEHRVKVDVVHNDNDTITYRQMKVYHFSRERSAGPDSETFTTINIPLITLVEFIYWNHASMTKLVSFLLRLLGKEELFITRSVRDIVWGYQDEMLHLGTLFDSSRFYTDIAGVLAGKNNTDDGVYTVFSGVKNLTILGAVSRYNGTSSLSFWSSSQANMINGTDGTLSPPFISKDLLAYMFTTDICRSVYGVYNEVVRSSHGIDLWRFRAPKSIMESGAVNPDNAGFCTPHGNCMGSGVLNISQCQMLDGFHIPIIASNPHFYLADRSYQDAIIGLDPNLPDLSVDIDIEPISGIVMHIAKRLQININIRGDTGIGKLENIKSMVFPVLWVNESASIDAAHAQLVYNELLWPLQIAHIIQISLFAIGGLFIIAGFVQLIYKNRRLNNTVVADSKHSEETEQLISEGTIENTNDTVE